MSPTETDTQETAEVSAPETTPADPIQEAVDAAYGPTAEAAPPPGDRPETTETDPPVEAEGDGEPAEGEAGSEEASDAPDTPATTPADHEPTFTQKQFNAAKRFGVATTHEDMTEWVAALGDRAPEALEKLSAAHSQVGRTFQKLQQRMAAPPDPAPGAGDRPPAADADEPETADAEFSEEDFYTPEAAEKANARFAALERQLAEQRAVIEQWRSAESSAVETRVRQESENWFIGDSAGMYEALGSGPSDALDPDGPENAARDAVFEKAKVLDLGYAATGQQMPWQELLDEAASTIYPEARATAKQAKIAEGKAKRRGQQTAPPTQRRTEPKYDSPEAKTFAALDDWETRKDVKFFLDT